jgi:aspartyl/asparaginyl beta-hydroxylase (cupin superfamily)
MKSYSSEVNQLAQSAANAQRSGDAAGAAQLWTQILARAPDHPEALFALGRQAMDARNLHQALDLLRRAAASNPTQPVIHLNIAYVAEAMGDIYAQGQALDAAIKADPYFYPAQFARGAYLEKSGRPKQAANVYSNALRISPPRDQLPPTIQAHAIRAANVVEAFTAQKEAFLRSRTAAARERLRGEDLGRAEESLAIMAGVKKAYVHQPVRFHFPELPATCFFKRSHFPWLAQLEAATNDIAAELEGILREIGGEFEAYVQKEATEPLNQWAELNKSNRWSALFLWRDGTRVDHICRRAPKTAALLEQIPVLDVPGRGPTAFFSALDAKTHIPPHTGVNNIRSIVHLPLIVPENTWFRVGNDKRPFKRGEAWVFDDSIEHEAMNDSDERRIILIFDVWNPNLTDAERQIVREMMAAEDEFERE